MHDSSRYNFMLSYTLWVARESNLAVRYGNGNASQIDDSALNNVTYPQIDPRSGFKVGAIYTFDHDDLDISFAYTWFYNRDNSYIPAMVSTANSTPQSFGTWSMNDTNTIFPRDSLSSAWNNSFNRIDTTLCGICYIGNYLFLRPFLGILFVWDSQNFLVSYGNSTKVTEWNNTQEWYGIGPYLGLYPSYIIWMYKDSCNSHSLSIFGKGGLSLAWSRSNTKMRQYMGEMAPTEKTPPTNSYREIFYYVSPMLESSLGFSWDGRYDGWTSMASISWDIEAWFSHNHMFDISRYYSRKGIYSMQGLTLTGGLGF